MRTGCAHMRLGKTKRTCGSILQPLKTGHYYERGRSAYPALVLGEIFQIESWPNCMGGGGGSELKFVLSRIEHRIRSSKKFQRTQVFARRGVSLTLGRPRWTQAANRSSRRSAFRRRGVPKTPHRRAQWLMPIAGDRAASVLPAMSIAASAFR